MQVQGNLSKVEKSKSKAALRAISQAGGWRQEKPLDRRGGRQPRVSGGIRHVLQSQAKVIAWKKRHTEREG